METLKFLMISTHFPPYHLGGDAILVDYLSKELIRRGHEVHVFFNPAAYKLLRNSSPREPDATSDERPIIHPYSSITRRLDPLLALSIGSWGRAERKLDELIAEIDPDVVHWHNPRGFIGRPRAFAGKISLYTTHDYTPVCPRSNLLKPDLSVCDDPRWCTVCCMRCAKPPQLWRAGKKRVLRFDEDLKILPPSEFMANRFRKEGVDVHRVLRLFVPDLSQEFHREKTPNDSIVYLGLIEKHKGVQTLIDAFIESRDEQGFRLHVIGAGSMKKDITHQVDALKLSDRISIHGYMERKEVENIRKNSVAQIVPSVWYENAPSTAVEAFSLGVPVIASNIGGLPEMVTPDAGSVTFPAGDARRLAELLIEFWANRDGMHERRKKARNAYEARFRPEIHVAEYLNIIEGL